MPMLSRLRPSHLLPWLLALALLAAACKPTPAALPGAEAEPAAKMQLLAQRLRDNDLVGYAKAMTTPEQYRQAESAWREGRSLWPLTELPLSDEVPKLLAALSAPDAARSLQKTFNTQFAGQSGEIRQAAQSLGMFGVQYLRNQADYSPEQRAYYVQWVSALSQWAAGAPLADRDRAGKAIVALTAAARQAGLGSESALRQAGMEESLRRLGPFFAVFKQVLADYGLALDTTFDELRAGQVSEQDGVARVRYQYPLAAARIDTTASLVRIGGQWYLQRSQEALTRQLAAPAEPAAAPPEDAAPAAGR